VREREGEIERERATEREKEREKEREERGREKESACEKERERERERERDLIGDAANLLICVLDVLFQCPCVDVCDLQHLYVWASIFARQSHV